MDKRISDIFSYGSDPVFWEYSDEIDPEEIKALTLRRIRLRRTRRVSRTLLIAAVIVSLLTVSAIAVGLSIQTQRREQLRQMLEIDANNVDSYTEFPVSSEAEPADETPGIVLISAIKDSEFETVYVSISPIEEDDMLLEERIAWTVDGVSYGSVLPVYDRSKLDYTEPVTDQYTGVTFYQPDSEQLRQAILENYDAETKSGLFEFSLLCSSDEYDINEPLEITIQKRCFNIDTFEISNVENLGTIRLEPIDQSCLSVRFPEPVAFKNSETGGKGCIIGADIYATGISWIIQHDDMADIYHKTDGTPPKLSGDELRALRFTWLRTLDDVFMSGATIEYTDGEKIEIASSTIRSDYDGEQVKCYVGTPETIDLSRIVSLTVLGETANIIR